MAPRRKTEDEKLFVKTRKPTDTNFLALKTKKRLDHSESLIETGTIEPKHTIIWLSLIAEYLYKKNKIQKATLCINSYFLLVIWSPENVKGSYVSE